MEAYPNFSPTLMKDKVIIITGGSRGGMLKEIAKAFLLHKAKGVILMSRNAEKNQAVATELSAYGTCLSEAGDVRKSEDCARVVAAAVKHFGRLDVLVNGAAGNFLASAAAITSNGFRTVLEIDTLGTFNMSQAAFNGFMKTVGGTIINISATLHWNGSAMQAHSSAAKAGVDALTKVLACEWGPYKVKVVGIVPGAIEGTEGFERLGDISKINNKELTNTSKASSLKDSSAEYLKKAMGSVPL